MSTNNSLYVLLCLLLLGFTLDFWFYDCYIIAAYFLPYHLCSIPPVSCFCFIIHAYSLLDITCYISTCSCMLVLTSRFSMHVYNLNLSIHMCLSLHATWPSQHHSLGSSNSHGSSCPGFRD